MVVALALRRVRRLVAIHEAGHAAMSLALGQGHQEGVSIVTSGFAAGFHAVGDQPDLSRLPRFLALREATKQALVTLAGPIAEAVALGEAFDVGAFLSEADQPSSDAGLLKEVLRVMEQHLGANEERAEELASVAAELLSREDVAGLVDAVTDALVRRGRIGAEGLGRLHEQWPTDPALIRLPTTMATAWPRSQSWST